MIRLLFILFLALFVFSCKDSSKEVDPLFYQISTADSTRCMNEIFAEIIGKASENQRLLDEAIRSGMSACGLWAMGELDIDINEAGKVQIGKNDSSNVTECVVEYFLMNRNLSEEEVTMFSMDRDYLGYDFPLYYRFGDEEIQRKIKETQFELNEISGVYGADTLLIKFYASKVDKWKQKLESLQLIGEATIDEISSRARVSINHQNGSKISEEVFNKVGLAYYHIRNYECMRYFNETYLNLYDRVQRKNRKLDHEKLRVLEALHPASIYDNVQEKYQPVLEPKRV